MLIQRTIEELKIAMGVNKEQFDKLVEEIRIYSKLLNLDMYLANNILDKNKVCSFINSYIQEKNPVGELVFDNWIKNHIKENKEHIMLNIHSLKEFNISVPEMFPDIDTTDYNIHHKYYLNIMNISRIYNRQYTLKDNIEHSFGIKDTLKVIFLNEFKNKQKIQSINIVNVINNNIINNKVMLFLTEYNFKNNYKDILLDIFQTLWGVEYDNSYSSIMNIVEVVYNIYSTKYNKNIEGMDIDG